MQYLKYVAKETLMGLLKNIQYKITALRYAAILKII